MPTKGSVIVLGNGPVPQSYVATSYPHRIMDADPDDYRSIHWTENLPPSLLQFLGDFKRKGDRGKTSKPRYLINLATFTPLRSSNWNNNSVGDPPGHLWYVYYWISRAVHKWNVSASPLPERLGLLTSEFPPGHLSHVAFGPTMSSEPDAMLLRSTGADEYWQYQWTALPFWCERDVQKHVEGAAALRNLEGEASRFNGRTEWSNGRLRGVTFGPDDSYIVFRGKKYDWDGAFPKELADALFEGKMKAWSINNCVLNHRNPNEYVLGFNEDEAHGTLRVYYALYQDFIPKFEEIIGEWAHGKGVAMEDCKIFPRPLTSAECQHDLPPLNVKRASSRGKSPLSEGHHMGSSNNAPTKVPSQRAIHRAAISQDSGISAGTGYVPDQQHAPSFQQPHPHAPRCPYGNGGTSLSPLNRDYNRASSPVEAVGDIPAMEYPPHGPQVIHPTWHQPTPQPVQHHHYYAAPKAPKKPGLLSRLWG